MTFIESLKIVWALQFAISGLLILRECQTDPETLEELQGFTPLITVFFFLLCCFGGWYVIYSYLKDYIPYWRGLLVYYAKRYLPFGFRHPWVWLTVYVRMPLHQKRRDLKAWYIRRLRRLAA